MRAAVLIIIALCAAYSGSAATEPPKPPYDLDFVAQFVAGEYVLVGRKPESESTYTGRVILSKHGDGLEFTRTVGGDTQHGSVVLDTKTSENGRPVLRMRFPVDGQPHTSGAAISTTTPGSPETLFDNAGLDEVSRLGSAVSSRRTYVAMTAHCRMKVEG